MKTDEILLIDIPTHPNPSEGDRSVEEHALRSVLAELGVRRGDQNWARKQMRSYSRGVLTIAGALRNAGFRVQYANPSDHPLYEIQEMAARAKLVGISAATPFADHAFELASAIQSQEDGRCIVFGGPHATALPEVTLRQVSSIDVVVLGDGEKALVALAEGVPSRDLVNTAFRTSGGVRVGEPVALNGMDFCAPDYGVLPAPLEEYRLNLQTARGCPYRCSFCAGHSFGVREIPECVIEDELRQLRQLAGSPQVHICDTDFARHPDRAEHLCALFRSYLPSETTFSCDIRGDCEVPEGFFSRLQTLGMRRVCIGFESSCRSALAAANKGTTFQQCLATTAQIRRESSMLIHAYWILGLPGMTKNQVEDDIECAAALIESDVLDEVATSVSLIPLPGSDIFSYPQRYGLLLAYSTWSSFFRPAERPVYVTDQLSSEDLVELYHRYLNRMRQAYEDRLNRLSAKVGGRVNAKTPWR